MYRTFSFSQEAAEELTINNFIEFLFIIEHIPISDLKTSISVVWMAKGIFYQSV